MICSPEPFILFALSIPDVTSTPSSPIFVITSRSHSVSGRIQNSILLLPYRLYPLHIYAIDTGRLPVVAEYRENSGDEKNDCRKGTGMNGGECLLFPALRGESRAATVSVVRAVQSRFVATATEAPVFFFSMNFCVDDQITFRQHHHCCELGVGRTLPH